jgi:hypothetical protein
MERELVRKKTISMEYQSFYFGRITEITCWCSRAFLIKRSGDVLSARRSAKFSLSTEHKMFAYYQECLVLCKRHYFPFLPPVRIINSTKINLGSVSPLPRPLPPVIRLFFCHHRFCRPAARHRRPPHATATAATAAAAAVATAATNRHRCRHSCHLYIELSV